MGIVERIKDLCSANNTSIKALERDIAISNGSIRHWNDKSPAVERVLLVADRFNVSIEWLITGNESDTLSDEEQKLIELYKGSNQTGKNMIMKHAEDIRKALPESPELEQSPTSQIG